MQLFYWPQGREAPDDGPDWAPIRGVYQQVDRFLSNVLARVGQNTVVLVVSDHGFGPRRLASNCLNPMLARVGLLRFRADVRPRSPLGFLLRWGRRRLPLPFQYLLAKRLPALYVRAVSQSKNPDVDWSRTQVFASLRGRSIWINLKGRQAYGIVPPEEYEALRQRVSELLLTLTDPATGRRVVRAVHRREDVFRGPYLDRAADLLVEWDEVIAGDGLAYPDGGQPVYARPQSRRVGEAGWTANHRSEGVFIAWGPGVIRPGVTLTESAHAASPVTHYDISPTVLHLQGLPVPADMDGRVLAEIFTEEYHRGHAVRIGQSGATADRTVGLEADEARLVEERLRSLGYLE
jgi:predicted AlkP superfamily phosphohydrolase/phosphomutase